MRRMFLILLPLLVSDILSSQSTYSKLYKFDPFVHANFNSIVVTDTCYYVSGVVADSISPYNAGALFAKLDLDGEVLAMKGLTDTVNRYETWFQSLADDEDGNLVTQGYNYGKPGNNNFFIKYDQNGAVKLLKYLKIDADVYQFIPYDMLRTLKGDFVLALANTDNTNGLTVTYTNVTKVNKDGQQLWNKKYKLKPFQSILHRMANTRDGGFILGSCGDDSPINRKNSLDQTVLVKFDSLGNKLWEYYSPSNEDWLGTLGGIFVNEQEEIVFGTAKGTAKRVNDDLDYFVWDWCISKMDKDRNVLWRTYFRPQGRQTRFESQNLWKMIRIKDKSGYVSVGKFIDTIGLAPGWIVKVSENGDSLWNRTYNFNNLHAVYTIRDVKEDAQGNLVMVGEIFDRIQVGSTNRQYGWLIKADKYGCIVPGCHTVAIDEGVLTSCRFLTYPNPTKDLIQFYCNAPPGTRSLQYRLLDVSGKEIVPPTSMQNDSTEIIFAANYPAGNYFLQLIVDQKLQKTEKIILTK